MIAALHVELRAQLRVVESGFEGGEDAASQASAGASEVFLADVADLPAKTARPILKPRSAHPCANCKRPRKNPVLLPKTIAQICRLTVHLLMDGLIWLTSA